MEKIEKEYRRMIFEFQSHLSQCESRQKRQGDGYAKWNHVFSTEHI